MFDVCKCATILNGVRRSFSSSFTHFVSNCSQTWQTSPFKGTDGCAVEKLMISLGWNEIK